MTRPSFTIELASDARFAKDLAAGGVFVPARGFRVLDEIDLVVRGNAGELCLHARVVYIDPATGCGLELLGFGPELKERLAQLASTPAEVAAVAGTKARRQRVLTSPDVKRSPQARDIAMFELDGDDLGDATGIVAGRSCDDDAQRIAGDDIEDDAMRIASDDVEVRIATDIIDDDAAWNAGDHDDVDAGNAARAHAAGDGATASAADHGANAHATDNDGEDIAVARTPSGRIPLNSTERLRGLSLADQIKVARGPSSSERMALERMYGKNVWDALLHNPGLTTPEVARLARLGTLPRVLLEVIVNNNTWLQVPEVRRALLANPRLGTDQIARVLRLLPKHELKVASTVPAYPASVRSMAKKLVKDSE